MEKEKQEISENAKKFMDWLQSLKPFELLDLLMNCGFLLGQTIKPEKEYIENGQNSTEK